MTKNDMFTQCRIYSALSSAQSDQIFAVRMKSRWLAHRVHNKESDQPERIPPCCLGHEGLNSLKPTWTLKLPSSSKC